VLARPAQQYRHVPVVEPVDEDHEPQGGVLVGDRPHAGQAHERGVVQQGAVPARVHRREVPQECAEVVEGPAGVAPHRRAHDVVGHATRVGDRRAVAVVLAVDPQHLEPGGQRLDLAPEVLRGEAALTERVGQRVRRRGQGHAAVGQLAQEPGHQDGVARVVELELVDGDQPVRREGLDGRGEAEGTDEVRVLHERPVRGPVGADGVRERGEQVGLASADHLGHLAQPRHRSLLAAERRVRPVGVEGLPCEVPRRDELGEKPCGRDLGPALREAGGPAGARDGECHERRA